MENKYPSREFAQAMANCLTHASCDECIAQLWCPDFFDKMLVGRTLLAMHDEVDRLVSENQRIAMVSHAVLTATNTAPLTVDDIKELIENKQIEILSHRKALQEVCTHITVEKVDVDGFERWGDYFKCTVCGKYLGRIPKSIV